MPETADEQRPPRIVERRFFDAYRATLKPHPPEARWETLVAQSTLPPVRYAFAASAVYSSNIEGNPIDLNSYLRSRMRGGPHPRAKEQAEIDALVAAYTFARTHALNERNVLQAHNLFAEPLLAAPQRGTYRTGRMFVYDSQGILYAAVEPELVPAEMKTFFADVQTLRRADLSVDEAFYHAALMHLAFVHIHPFEDGNGRAARLLEKWFLADKLGSRAWKIPSEEYYWRHRPAYYAAIHLGPTFYDLDYDTGGPDAAGCVPFLTLLPNALRT